jgi:hypothetical protein
MSSVAAIPSSSRALLRILGLAFGLAVVVGHTVGVGIMRTSGPTAGRLSEPALRRPFRAFGYPWVPGLALITTAVLLIVFVLGNTGPSLLAIAVVAVTYPLFRVVQHRFASKQGERCSSL